jgi:mannosyltransferase
MNLLLDNIIFSLQNSGGISSYWFELLRRIVNEEDVDLQLLENSNSKNNLFRKDLLIDDKYCTNYKTNLISRILPVKISSRKNLIFHSSYYRYSKFKDCKVVTTVHDFIQEKVHNSNLSLNSLMKRQAIINSDSIIAISENTRLDLLNFFPKLEQNKVHVIYNGVSDNYYPLNTIIKDRSDSVLFVGSRVDYKNFNLAVEVISKFPNLNFYIVGNSLNDSEIKLLNSKLSVNKWKLFVNPSNNELNTIYNQSSLLIYPSSYEGFGIPVIEAMKAGCPVLALNSSSIPEVAGNAAFLVDKSCLDHYYYGIQQILNNRKMYVDLGILNAARFSWEKTYLETLKLYKSL